MSASAKKLHPDFIGEVKQRIDIVDVISGHINLKKRGKDYLGLCPFHDERTPSFNVSPEKGLAYCFGCTWGGNAIKFLMELGRISFTDAVLELARSVGVPIRYEDGSSDDLPASSLQFKPRKTPQQGASDNKICQLNLPTRDAAYRKLSGKLDLSLRHREKLKRDRRLSDDQINFAYQQGWLRTWQPGNNYHGISKELAGVDPISGKLTGVDGIAIAALDPTNQITGFQLAPDNREKFGKYIWVSSNNQEGSSPHLPNGELPVFCWRHPDAPLQNEVWLCEGALKSLLVAQRLWFVEKRTDVVVIGSASSARYGEKTLRDYLAQLGAHAIRLMPDAGAVANPGISSANEQTLKWVQEWGYNTSVGWWNQVDKSQQDIDELENWGAIAYISPEEFFALGKKSFTPPVQPPQIIEAEPPPDEYAAYIAKEQEREQFEGLKSVEPTAEDLWKLLHVPDEVQFTERLTLSDEALQADFLCIKAPMGSGKTYTMAQICATAGSLLIVVNTIALGEALALRYGCIPYNHPKIKAGELSISDIDRVVITSESLWKIRTLDKKFDVVLIDEADQVLSSAVASVTTRRKRQEILTNLEYFAHQSQRFILMDADLSTPVVEFGQYLCDRKSYIVQNASIPHAGETFYQFESQEAHIAYVCDQLEWDNKVLIVTDSKKKVKSLGAYFSGLENIEGVENLNLGEELYERFQKEFPDKKGMIIHGDNSSKDEIRNLIKRINELLPVLKLDYLIFNSCVQSGVSIEVVNELGEGYFQALSCLFTGMTLPHTELGQVSHRWRPNDCEKSFSFAEGSTFIRETNISQIKRDLFAKHWEEVQALGIDAKTGMPDPEITEFRVQIEARRNWSLNNIQEAFKRHLEGMGYEIAPHPDEDLMTDIEAFKEALKARGEVIDQALIATIINSPRIDQKAYKQLEKKPNPDYYDRAIKIRYELNDFTGMEPTEKLVKTWLEDDIRKKLTRLDFLFQPKQAAKIADLANRRKYHYVFDQCYNLLEQQLLQALDALAYLDPTKVYSNTDLKPLEVACKAQAAKIKRLLGVTIYQPPQYLKRGLKEAAEGVKALFDASVQPLSKWLLTALSSASLATVTKETFKESASANKVCKQLSIPGQILCEALSVAIRHRVSDMSASKVHAALCEAVGMKREQASQNASGRGYRIKAESWAFAQAVLQHRQQQRVEHHRQKEEAIGEEAARFSPSSINEQQQVIEAQIENAIASTSIPPSPDLIYSQTPPEIYKLSNLGGVCESERGNSDEQEYSVPQLNEQEYPLQPVNVGDEISVPCLGEMGTIAAIAPGRDVEFNFHDYIRFLPNDGGEKWIPIVWAQSPDGRSIRPNPIPNPNFIPLRSRQTWANWLLAMTESNQLVKFEQRRTVAEIEGAISTLSADQLLDLQHKFAGWGIDRNWLPSIAYTQDLGSVLHMGIEMGVEALKEFLCSLKQAFNASLLRRVWQSLSREMKTAIASLAPEASALLLTN